MSDDTPGPKPDAPSEALPPTGRPAGTSPTPHDAMFRVTMSDPARAQAFLRDHLPPEFAEKMSDRPPRIVDGSFVDDDLRGTRSDLLLEVEMKSGNPALVYVLVEHKSTPDPGLPLQLDGYMIRIWERWARGEAKRLRSRPPIIPVVVYSGSARWTVPGNLAETVAGDDPDLVFLPGQGYVLLRIAEMSVEELSRHPTLRAVLLAMTRRALAHRREVAPAVAEGSPLRRILIRYIRQVHPRAEIEELLAGPDGSGGDEMEGLVGAIMEALRAEGMAEGETARGVVMRRAEGEARGIVMGRVEGRRRDMTRLLERRFGPLPRDITQRIAAADHDLLDRWLERMPDPDGLAAVLGDWIPSLRADRPVSATEPATASPGEFHPVVTAPSVGDEMVGLVGAIMKALRAEGEARGIEMGMAEGRRRDLTRLLERRFGPLPRDITQRIAAADDDAGADLAAGAGDEDAARRITGFRATLDATYAASFPT